MIPPCSAKPSVSPTVKVLDPFRSLTIMAAWFFSVTGTNTMWHTLSVSSDFSSLTSTGWPPTVRVRSSPLKSSAQWIITNNAYCEGEPRSRYESGGHSINLVKLYREPSLTGYSTVSRFSERAFGGFEESQQATIGKEARRICESTLATSGRLHPNALPGSKRAGAVSETKSSECSRIVKRGGKQTERSLPTRWE